MKSKICFIWLLGWSSIGVSESEAEPLDFDSIPLRRTSIPAAIFNRFAGGDFVGVLFTLNVPLPTWSEVFTNGSSILLDFFQVSGVNRLLES